MSTFPLRPRCACASAILLLASLLAAGCGVPTTTLEANSAYLDNPLKAVTLPAPAIADANWRSGAAFYAGKLTLSPDGQLLAACNGSTLCIADAARLLNIRSIPLTNELAVHVAFSQDGRSLAAACALCDGAAQPLYDRGRLRSWTIPALAAESEEYFPDRLPVQVYMDSSTKTPAAGGAISADYFVHPPGASHTIIGCTAVYCTQTPGHRIEVDMNYRTVETGSGPHPYVKLDVTGDWCSLAVDSSGSYLAYGTLAKPYFKIQSTVTLWNIDRDRPVQRFEFENLGEASVVALSPGGNLVAVASGAGILVIDVPAQRIVAQFRHGAALVTGLVFSSSGRLLYSLDHDGNLAAWNVYRP